MKEYLDRSMSLAEYCALVDRLVEEGRTTGPAQSELMAHYTFLNRQRMIRLTKTVELGDAVRAAVKGASRPQIWLIITEAWCGDAAQNIPVIEKIGAENGIIETRYILRDENPRLMDRYLTLGARSIPKLVALDAETLEELWTWGPRPAAAQELFLKLRSEGFAKDVITGEMQRWYNTDRGRALQKEFTDLITRHGGGKTAAKAA